MNADTISVAHSLYTNKGAFALLLGSGISRSSGIPTGWEITLELIARIATLKRIKPPDDLVRWYVGEFNESPDYSNILEKLTNTQEERVNLLKPFIEPTIEEAEEGLKKLTRAHYNIAGLVKAGYIKVIITTNFDRLLENALKNEGIEPNIISNPNHIDNVMPLVHSPITVIKINGDYLDTKFLNLKSELSQYDERLEGLMKRIFEEFGLVTCGWSASWDIALVNILKSSNKFRFSNYFCNRNSSENTLSDISHFRKGKLVKIKDADSFFEELGENIEALEKLNFKNPLQPDLALTRVKKYVAKDDLKIDLYDFVHEISGESLKALREVQVIRQPSFAQAKEILDCYFKSTELLVKIIAEAVFWSKPIHSSTWLSCMKQFGDFGEERENLQGFQQVIAFVPLLFIRYTIGISSLKAENYELLRMHLNNFTRERYNVKEVALQLTLPLSIIPRDDMQKIMGKKYHTPVSYYLQEKLRDYFRGIIPIEKEFEALFDEYEVLSAIYLISITGQGSWSSIGAFGYRNKKLVKSFMEELDKEGASHCFIKRGLFETKDEMRGFAEVLDTFLTEDVRIFR